MATVADIAEIQRVAMTSLNQRMADFEAHLKASSPGADLGTLHKDFGVFKEHVWNVLSVLQQQITELSKYIDVMEMRHRKKFLLLGGLPEESNEKIADTVTTVLQNELGLSDFKSSALTVCHRLGTASDSRQRPVLLRFADPEVRALIWKTKTKLKGSSFVVSEFLTRQRQMAFSTARKLFGVTNVWTMDGNVNIKLPDGKRRRVFGHQEVVALGAEHGKSLDDLAGLTTTTTATHTSTTSPVPAQVSARSRRNIPKKK